MISHRLPPNLQPNALARAVAARRARGGTIIDLTESNPTRVGLAYPPDLLAPLAGGAGLVYDPTPLGLPSAREAVSGELARHGVTLDPSRIALTASTSEAYGLLFKLFCDAGEGVLVPRPSYPLFEHLTRLESVEAVPYALEYHGRWRIDAASLTRGAGARTRAVVVVSPNNPTGSFLHRDDLTSVVSLCRERGLALIGDEVFWDYPLDPAPAAVSVLSQDQVLTCALGGLSKSVGLPQVKLGWIAWAGPPGEVAAALGAYEVIADSYLSVSTPVQVASPALLARGAAVRAQIQERVRRNRERLRGLASAHPDVDVMPVEGGWSAVVRVPAIRPEEQLVVELAIEDDVLVHPGYFFDFPAEAFIVTSLLVDPGEFDRGIERVLARASGSRT